MFEEIWLIPLGFIAGILGSIIGLGGGIIIVPVLTFMGFSPTLAEATVCLQYLVTPLELQLHMLNKNV